MLSIWNWAQWYCHPSGPARWRLVGNSDIFMGPPSEAEFQFHFRFQRFWLNFFYKFRCWKIDKSEFRFWNLEFKKKIPRNSVHLISYQKIIAISFPTKITSLPPYLHLLKMVASIPTSTQNGCRHTYIYQNGCCHLYIYSKRLPPYLHLLKTVAAISTSTQNGCRHTYINLKWLPPSFQLLNTVAAISTSTKNK